jgi:hypothetical protein
MKYKMTRYNTPGYALYQFLYFVAIVIVCLIAAFRN